MVGLAIGSNFFLWFCILTMWICTSSQEVKFASLVYGLALNLAFSNLTQARFWKVLVLLLFLEHWQHVNSPRSACDPVHLPLFQLKSSQSLHPVLRLEPGCKGVAASHHTVEIFMLGSSRSREHRWHLGWSVQMPRFSTLVLISFHPTHTTGLLECKTVDSGSWINHDTLWWAENREMDTAKNVYCHIQPYSGVTLKNRGEEKSFQWAEHYAI